MSDEYIIEMQNITKEFGGFIANDDITLQLKKGEIHALLGENGAGKSTLMSVLFGLYQPEKGRILKNGKEIQIKNPNDANRYGIGMVHQHFKLVHNFTALQNIVLGVEETKHRILQMDAARKKVEELSKRYGLAIDIDKKIENMTVGMQQRVEILKMLYRDNEILIFDEPTAVLTPDEIRELMKVMTGLAKEGKSLLFITHKLNEIKEIADRCTVLRKGVCTGGFDVAEVPVEAMSEMMVGRKINLTLEKAPAKVSDTVLEVKDLMLESKKLKKRLVDNVSFSIKAGEVVCIAGIDGNGQNELIQMITGLEKPDGGKVILNGEDITSKNVRYRNTHGMSHIPEDRHKHGLVLDYTLMENLALQTYFNKETCRYGFLKFGKMNEQAERLIGEYDIRSGAGTKTIVRSMSGGNQQKAIIAREIDKDPDLLVAVQPTRGLDVGAIEYIHKQILKVRDAGKAVLLVSFELSEVMNLADRIYVIYEGSLVAELDPSTCTIQEIGLYMGGSKKGESNNEKDKN